MKSSKAITKKLTIIALLTVALTVFFYVHETFPKPIRAASALLGTPAAIASGLSYYLHLGIDVYNTPVAIVVANFIASVIVVILGDAFLRWRKKIKQLT